jgi:ribosomal protein L40E
MAAAMIGDVDDTIECSNCGHANPSWAQVCRNCGVSLRRDLARPVTRPQSPFPTDSSSLLSLGAAVGSIVLAIFLGLFFSAINPTQPTVGLTSSPSPTPRATPRASTASVAPTATPKATPKPTPKPVGTIKFGTGLTSARTVTNPTTSFGPTGYFAYSVSMPAPFGVTSLSEETARVANGKETVVDPRTSNPVRVSSSAKIFGFRVSTSSLLRAWGGGGVFIMRVFRGNETIAEGQFTLSSG